MGAFNLKPTHKAVKAYYESLKGMVQLHLRHEGAVAPAFATLLKHCARPYDWMLVEEYHFQRGKSYISVDGALVDGFNIPRGVWEAKDTEDDMDQEIRKKFDKGYPKDNILFQAPDQLVLWQNGRKIFDESILDNPQNLVDGLRLFFEYTEPVLVQWDQAIQEFKQKVPDLAKGVLDLIERERKTNQKFIQAFDEFSLLCRETINVNLSDEAIEEMLIQHLLTERIFRRVFKNPDFVERNAIASKIEQVIVSLTSKYFSKQEFLQPLDRFYMAIEATAERLDDYTQKQHFLNTVYEQFFQGFSVKMADTHGIVYTPQAVVDFMVRSIEYILKEEFGKSLSDKGVPILDPFVGTGNFITRIMREIQKSRLPYKFTNELFCNEVLLLPYYIASMNIEHEFYSLTGNYEPFEGICMVDTFELAEPQHHLSFSQKNTERVIRQKASPIFVIVGNPPYNAGQVNENDNNKNRKYPAIDERVAKTYSKDSKATNKNALSDPYIKAVRWASDRIIKNGEGIVAFITNNGFLDGIALEGMREHLGKDFSKIYHIDLKGNARTSGERRRRECGNIFDDAIRVGVGISFFVKKKDAKGPAEIYLYSVDDYLKSREKKLFLEKAQLVDKVSFHRISPDKNYTWLTEGMQKNYETLLPIGIKEGKGSGVSKAVFNTYGRGVATCRDSWAYSYSQETLSHNIKNMIEVYNGQVFLYGRKMPRPEIDAFVLNDATKISWSEGLKNYLKRQILIEFSPKHARISLYRPFTKESLYFDKYLNERRYVFPHILPVTATEKENLVICVNGVGSNKIFAALATNLIPCLDMLEKTQCFPFFSYDEDGSNRKENITDWALEEFRKTYKDKKISKWDIFYYIYGVLYHRSYREKYQANLKRELPRIPYTSDFWGFSKAGKALADLHVNYEAQSEHPLKHVEKEGEPLDFRVVRMKLSKDKTFIVYNKFLTLTGIPPEAHDYRLGNRSALEWIVDQYCVKTDKRSGIVNDPNRMDDPEYIIRLIKKIVTVSLKTVKIVNDLPSFVEQKAK